MAGGRKRPNRPNQTGRSGKSPPFVMLPHRVVESSAWACLDPVARCSLIELIHLFNGSNNGSLYLSTKDLTARLGYSDERAAIRSLDMLERVGLIEQTKGAHFDIKTGDASRARCWRLAWHSWPENPQRSRRAPVFDFERYEATDRRADRRLRALARFRKAKVEGKFPAVDTTVAALYGGALRGEPAVETTAANPENGAFQPIPVTVLSTAYKDLARGSGVGWWVSEAEMNLLVQVAYAEYLAGHGSPIAMAA